jgi:uncharacterized protein YxjI
MNAGMVSEEDMRYVMKQKLFSWADSYVIHDEAERELFQVSGKLFSFGHPRTTPSSAGNASFTGRQSQPPSGIRTPACLVR